MAGRRVEEGSNWLGGNRTREAFAVAVGLLGGWVLGCAWGAITDHIMNPEDANRLARVEQRHYRTGEGYIETVTVVEDYQEDLLPFGMDVSTFVGGLIGSATGFAVGRAYGRNPELAQEFQQECAKIVGPDGIIPR